MVENPPANAGDIRDKGLIPGLGRFAGERMATHSSILAWRIPWICVDRNITFIILNDIVLRLGTEIKKS